MSCLRCSIFRRSPQQISSKSRGRFWTVIRIRHANVCRPVPRPEKLLQGLLLLKCAGFSLSSILSHGQRKLHALVVHASEMEGGCSSTSSLAIAMLLLLSTRYVKMNLGSPDDDLKPRWFGKIRQCRASERYSVTAVHWCSLLLTTRHDSY